MLYYCIVRILRTYCPRLPIKPPSDENTLTCMYNLINIMVVLGGSYYNDNGFFCERFNL